MFNTPSKSPPRGSERTASQMASQTASQTASAHARFPPDLNGMPEPEPFDPNAAMTPLTPGAAAFFERELFGDDEDPETQDDPTDVALSYVEVPQITDLVAAGIISVSKIVRERYMATDATSIEDGLLNATTATTASQCTWETVSQAIASDPLSSYIVLMGTVSMQPALDQLLFSTTDFQAKRDLAKKFIEWQNSKKNEQEVEMEPIDTKLKDVGKEIEDLERKLAKKKEERDALLLKKADPQRLIASFAKNLSDANKTHDNAAVITAVSKALMEWLRRVIDGHNKGQATLDKKSGGDVAMEDDGDAATENVLLFAKCNSPLELGTSLGLNNYQDVAFEDGKERSYYRLFAIYIAIRFLGYEYSKACGSVFNKFPRCGSKTTSKRMLEFIICRLCGIVPPATLVMAIQNEERKRGKKRKSEETVSKSDAMMELISKAHPADISAAKTMQGDLGHNLYKLHQKRLKTENQSDASNAQSNAGNGP